jgi:hypothetical protein
MSLPYPKPITREQARLNAIHYAEEAGPNMTAGAPMAHGQGYVLLAKAWAAIADTFPFEDTQVMTEVNADWPDATINFEAEEPFEDWSRRQIDKLTYIIQETMNRVDRLEAPESSVTNFELEVLKDLRAGRLVTHTPEYVAKLRADVPTDDQAVVHKDYIADLEASRARWRQNTLEKAAVRVRQYMGDSGPFRTATIEGVVRSMWKTDEDIDPVVTPVVRSGISMWVSSVAWNALRDLTARYLNDLPGRQATVNLQDDFVVGVSETRLKFKTEGYGDQLVRVSLVPKS